MKLRSLWRWIVGRMTREPSTLRTLDFPSYEDLQRIGLDRTEFHAKYIAGTSIRGCRSPESYRNKVLSRFWADYPALAPRRPE